MANAFLEAAATGNPKYCQRSKSNGRNRVAGYTVGESDEGSTINVLLSRVDPLYSTLVFRFMFQHGLLMTTLESPFTSLDLSGRDVRTTLLHRKLE